MFKNFLIKGNISKNRIKEIEQQKADFNNIMNFALSVIETHEKKSTQSVNRKLVAEKHPILDIINLLGRKLQTDYLVNLLFNKDESPLDGIEYSTVLFETKNPITLDGKYFEEIIKELTINKNISLGKDLILPWPWKRNRLISSICNIGKGRASEEWKQDQKNHFVELWLTLGIAWVNGGNHSIATGVIQCQGLIKPEYVYDISPIYKYIYTDGINYIRKQDGKVISPVNNVEFAAIFEIGRVMSANSITF